jgi:hypothetical protein
MPALPEDMLIYDGEDQLTQDQYDVQRRRLFLLEQWADTVNAVKARRCDTCCWYREKFQAADARDRQGAVINLPQGTCHAALPAPGVDVKNPAKWGAVKANEACRHWSNDMEAPPGTVQEDAPVVGEKPRRAIDL